MFSSRARYILAFSRAILEGRITPHFQPIVSLRDSTIVGFEILARWYDEIHGEISPTVFIPHAEREELLDELTESLMRQAFTTAANWPDRLFLAINVSPNQLQSEGLPHLICDAAKATGFPLSRLHIEITETAVLKDTDAARAMVGRFLEIGCQIVMDDFGTGYASLTWLQALPFTKIKIDASFVRSMMDKRESRKIVVAVVGLGQSLGLSVVAEGVETETQAELLRQIGCEFAQGFLFGAAVHSEMVPGLLDKTGTTAGPVRRKLSLEQRACQITAMYNSPDLAIGFLSPDLIIIDASETFANRLNIPRESLIGRHICDAFSTRDACLDFYRQYQLNGLSCPSFKLDLPYGRTDMVVLQCVRDEVGEVLGHSILGVDSKTEH